MQDDSALCYLLSLADSTLPVGGLAHSCGLEQAAYSGDVDEASLGQFLVDWCDENLRFEAVFCAGAHRLAQQNTDFPHEGSWQALNQKLSAMKPSREGRLASERMGMRLLQLFQNIGSDATHDHASAVNANLNWGHYSIVFGYLSGKLGVSENATLLAYMNQSVTSLVSAAQRLLPVGQITATKLIWSVKPLLLSIASQIVGESHLDEATCFSPTIDIASMAHPYLHMRLFLS